MGWSYNQRLNILALFLRTYLFISLAPLREIFYIYTLMKNKYQELTELHIEDIDHQGRGTVKHNGKWVLVENALPGEVVDVKIVRKDKGSLIGRPFLFHQLSSVRKKATCMHFGVCGGCKW